MKEKRILIEIGHPAHVHHFKHMYWELEKKGWKGLFVTKDKECAIDLLKAYHLPYKVLGVNRKGIARKIISLPMFSLKMIKIAREFRPDIFVSRVSPLSGYASRLLRKPHITFTDTENVRSLDMISEPFADVILTAYSYKREHGKRQLRYPGYHELAYLHPNRFKPDKKVLVSNGIDPDNKYAIVRFVAWGAHHDIGHRGISDTNRIKLVEDLASYVQVYISSEAQLPRTLEKYRLSIKPQDMHQVLYQAHLFIGESATMASECACLGTPAIYLDNVGRGYTDDLGVKYGLVYNFSESAEDQTKAMDLAIQIAQDGTAKRTNQKLTHQMLNDKIDVSRFMVWFVENYPNSETVMRKSDFNFDRFK
jgi:uncharacterized protein